MTTELDAAMPETYPLPSHPLAPQPELRRASSTFEVCSSAGQPKGHNRLQLRMPVPPPATWALGPHQPLPEGALFGFDPSRASDLTSQELIRTDPGLAPTRNKKGKGRLPYS